MHFATIFSFNISSRIIVGGKSLSLEVSEVWQSLITFIVFQLTTEHYANEIQNSFKLPTELGFSYLIESLNVY